MNNYTDKEKEDLICEYLSNHPCVECGEADIVILEFANTYGDKLHDVLDMVRAAYKFHKIKEEIDKCDVVCSNCHIRRRSISNNDYKIQYKMLH